MITILKVNGGIIYMADIPEKSKFKLTKGFVILTVFVVLFLVVMSYMYFIYAEESQYTSLPEINASDRILIFAPHPDDESLGTGGIIKKALENNASVKVVMMTNGDGMGMDQFSNYLESTNNTNYNGSMGDLRHEETINAMNELGLSQDNIIFLGYPDSGLKSLLETNWDDDNLFRNSKGSNQHDHSPYNFSYEENAPYSGSNVVKNIAQIMNDYQPTIIYYPDDGDDHPDHFATSAFVRYTALLTDYKGHSYTYLVHKGISWPNPLSYQPGSQLTFPSELSVLGANWFNSPLSDEEEKSKESAVKAHASQVFILKNLLLSFVRTDEIFAVYPIIQLQKVNDINSIWTTLPSSSYNDVKNDAKTGMLQKGDDLTAAGVAYDDNNVYLFSRSNKIQEGLAYNFHLRLFNGTNFNRVDLIVKNGKAEYQSLAKNSIKSDKQPTVEIKNNVIVISFPRELFNGTRYMMMSTDLVNPQDNGLIDYLSYRVFKFPNNLTQTADNQSEPILSGTVAIVLENHPG
jgi:LmbE family N-acetylglucosaminyl deacetylase